jgi:hypothetical protein
MAELPGALVLGRSLGLPDSEEDSFPVRTDAGTGGMAQVVEHLYGELEVKWVW